MKWVVFHGIDGADEAQKVIDFLTEKKVKCTAYQFDATHTGDLSSAKLSENIEKLCEILTDITHCVLVNIQQIPMDGAFLYTLGMIGGTAIPVFTTGSGTSLPDCLLNGFTPTCPTMSEMLKMLEMHFPLFLKEELNHMARKKLFNLGIPLTPDSFSQHISSGNIEVCDLFLEASMDVNSCDAAGTPMLCIATRNGKLNMAQWLLDKNADINAVSDDRGYTPVMDAIWRNKYDLIELFVHAGADLNGVGKDGQPLLVLAAGVGNVKICTLLSENGADVNIKDRMGMSALDYAILFKKQALVDVFEAAKK